MKNIFLFLVFFGFGSILFGGDISIQIHGLRNSRASLYSIELGKTDFIENIYSNESGLFNITDNGKFYSGFYRVKFGGGDWLNFIYDDKEISIEAEKNNLHQTIKVKKSDTNKLYYRLLQITSLYKNELSDLFEAAAKYPKSDKRFRKAENKFKEARRNYLEFTNKFAQSNDNSFISSYIKSAREPIYNLNLSVKENRKYSYIHFWDNVDFDDIELLHSDLFINKTIDYFNLIGYSDKDLSRLENKFIKSVDVILDKAKINELVYRQLIEYLLTGFKKLKFENVIDYIINNYVIQDDVCLEGEEDNFIQIRINQAKYFRKDVKVPNIELPDAEGKIIPLYGVSAEKILIIFYSSQCPHCQKFLPELLKFYSEQSHREFKIYGISLDTDFAAWQTFVKNNNYNWINVSDLKGWESDVSFDFYVYATPTMFLVDKNFKIIGKPKDMSELKSLIFNRSSQ